MLNKLAPAKSLGGGQLSGTNIVRVVYMDEAGRGLIGEEPYFVVACAITHPDTQWHHLRHHYVDLANDVFDLRKDEAINEYVFQAKHVWHGGGDFPRDKFSLTQRMNLMNRLSQVPSLYSVPICVVAIDRAKFAKDMDPPSKTEKIRRQLEHSYAYAIALQYVDSWMAQHCHGEVATVTAEDTDEVKATIQLLHQGLQKVDTADEFYDRGMFVTRNIVDTVNFAPKDMSPLLQIADHCAFLAKRTTAGCVHAKKYWRNISPMHWKKNTHESSGIVLRVQISDLIVDL